MLDARGAEVPDENPTSAGSGRAAAWYLYPGGLSEFQAQPRRTRITGMRWSRPPGHRTRGDVGLPDPASGTLKTSLGWRERLRGPWTSTTAMAATPTTMASMRFMCVVAAAASVALAGSTEYSGTSSHP